MRHDANLGSERAGRTRRASSASWPTRCLDGFWRNTSLTTRAAPGRQASNDPARQLASPVSSSTGLPGAGIFGGMTTHSEVTQAPIDGPRSSVVVDGQHLSLDEVAAVARFGATVALSADPALQEGLRGECRALPTTHRQGRSAVRHHDGLRRLGGPPDLPRQGRSPTGARGAHARQRHRSGHAY